MEKLFIEDLPIKGKKVLMRVDFNVPLDGDKNIVDATRIEAALPSIQYVLDRGGALILMSHLGRPKNMPNSDLSLAPIASFLAKMLEKPVKMAPNSIGSGVRKEVENLKAGEVLLLENLRFHRAEEHPDEDPEFAEELASYGDVYVNDAFGCAHRKHASIYNVPLLFKGKAAAGYLLEKELHFLGKTLEHPESPFCTILGGAKISTKIGVIKALLKKVDKLLIGGAMAYTFLKAQGYKIGSSLVENDCLSLAREVYSSKIVLPEDLVCAKECSNDAPTKIVSIQSGIPDGYQGFDIGPKTIEKFSQILKEAKTILWNGPLGVYEIQQFSKGTRSIAKIVQNQTATTIVGGGDLVAALNAIEGIEKFTHVSTGGGATLEYIENGSLPGIEALTEKASSQAL